MNADALTLITVVTPYQKFLSRRQSYLGGAAATKKAIFPDPVAYESDHRSLPGDIMFEFTDGGMDQIPQAEVILNGLKVTNQDSDPLNRIELYRSIRVLGVACGSHDLSAGATMPITCAIGGIITMNNSGMMDIQPGQVIMAQIPATNRPTAQRLKGAQFPQGDKVRKLETVPLQNAEFPLGVGNELVDLLQTKEMFDLFCLFAELTNRRTDTPTNMNSSGEAELCMQRIGGSGLDISDDRLGQIRAYYTLLINNYNTLDTAGPDPKREPLKLAATKRITSTLGAAARILLSNSHCNVLGVAQSGARPNEAFNIMLSPPIKGSIMAHGAQYM